MRKFYIIEGDPYIRGFQSVVSHELAGFDHFLLYEGKWIDRIPVGLRIKVSGQKRTHLLGNPFGWKIMSDEAVAIIRQFAPETDIQLIDIIISNFKTNILVDGYHLVNCLRVIPALDVPHTNGILYMDKVVLRDIQIPQKTHLFLLGEWTEHWVVSEQLWENLSKLVGFSAIQTKVIN